MCSIIHNVLFTNYVIRGILPLRSDGISAVKIEGMESVSQTWIQSYFGFGFSFTKLKLLRLELSQSVNEITARLTKYYCTNFLP